MSIIHGERNMIIAYEPEAGDAAVIMRAGALKTIYPIHRYHQAIRDSEAFAYQMGYIELAPVNVDELLKFMGTTIDEIMSGLSEAELLEVRQECIDTFQEVIRDCDDPELVKQARTELSKMGVAAEAH